MTKPSPDPYVKARREFDDIYINQAKRIWNWQMAAALFAVIALLAVGSSYYAINRSHVIPYVVQVDNIGRAIAIDEAKESPMNDTKVIKAFVYQYLDMSRSVVSDPTVLTRNIQQVYRESIKSVQVNFLDPFYKVNNPFDYAQKTGTRYIQPIIFLQAGDNTYSVEWQEIESNYQNQVLSDTHYKALITVVQIPHSSDAKYQEDPLNPFGFYVSSVSWDKLT